MKNILDQIKNGNFTDIGNTINNALGGNLGETFKQGTQSLGNAGTMAKEKIQNSNLNDSFGGVGGLIGSAAVGGLLGALFTSKKTKKIAKSAAKVGGAAALGGLAWTFYQKWSQNKVNDVNVSDNQANTQDNTVKMLPPAQNTALLLLEAMIYAARADGHIDDEERNAIKTTVAALFPNQEMAEIVDAFVQKPIDPHALAARVVNKEEAYDLYRLSCAAINIDSFMERSYLDGLANALGITKEEQAQLEKEAEEV